MPLRIVYGNAPVEHPILLMAFEPAIGGAASG